MKQMELTTTKRKVKISTGDQMFYLISGLILTAIFLLILYPCIFVVSASFSSGTAVQSGKVILWPVDISFVGYDTVFHRFYKLLILHICRNHHQRHTDHAGCLSIVPERPCRP